MNPFPSNIFNSYQVQFLLSASPVPFPPFPLTYPEALLASHSRALTSLDCDENWPLSSKTWMHPPLLFVYRKTCHNHNYQRNLIINRRQQQEREVEREVEKGLDPWLGNKPPLPTHTHTHTYIQPFFPSKVLVGTISSDFMSCEHLAPTSSACRQCWHPNCQMHCSLWQLKSPNSRGRL